MENHEKEEWMGWKIVEGMLNHSDEIGIYPTSECYQKLYEFVIAQKEKVRLKQREDIIKKVLEFTAEELSICRTEKTTRTPAQFANSRITRLSMRIIKLIK